MCYYHFCTNCILQLCFLAIAIKLDFRKMNNFFVCCCCCIKVYRNISAVKEQSRYKCKIHKAVKKFRKAFIFEEIILISISSELLDPNLGFRKIPYLNSINIWIHHMKHVILIKMYGLLRRTTSCSCCGFPPLAYTIFFGQKRYHS